MRVISWGYQFIVALGVAAVCYHYYASLNANDLAPPVDAIVYYAVAAAALVVPLFWAITHLCGGILFGIAAGGIVDGMRLGLILGLGMSIGKLWPYTGAAAVGVYLGEGPLLYVWGGAILCVLLFALDRVIHYFWNMNRNSQ